MKIEKAALRSLVLMILAATVFHPVARGSQAGKEHNRSDEELNATYRRVLAIMTDPEDRRLFVEAQRSWIKFRDAEMAFHAHRFPGSKGGLSVSTDMIKARTEALKTLLTDAATQAHEHPFADEPKR
ncbi:MAG: lysozyme inhibitor LprI family protein [Verrucomicrobiaceae bacterium]|nr:lysozyme inhibitor LprI family protein [Verrucomicrobiaceae bacterium]